MFYFVLDKDNNPISEPDFLKWSNFILKEENALLRKSSLYIEDELITVTTSFTGQSKEAGDKCINAFVTRIDGGLHHGNRLLTSTYSQALNDHEFFIGYCKGVKESVGAISTQLMSDEERWALREAKQEYKERFRQDEKFE